MNKLLKVIMLILLIRGVFFIGGCSTSGVLIEAKSGAQLWGENCFRCHNAPSPDTFSDVEWDIAIMHMRVRANLTQQEAQKIVAFLKTAN